MIVNYSDGSNQSVTPFTSQSLQCDIPSGIVTPRPAGAYVYFARVGANGLSCVHIHSFSDQRILINLLSALSIQGGNGSVQSWEITSATTGSQVSFADGQGGEKSFWVLQSV
jgi:hypothetical protein